MPSIFSNTIFLVFCKKFSRLNKILLILFLSFFIVFFINTLNTFEFLSPIFSIKKALVYSVITAILFKLSVSRSFSTVHTERLFILHKSGHVKFIALYKINYSICQCTVFEIMPGVTFKFILQ